MNTPARDINKIADADAIKKAIISLGERAEELRLCKIPKEILASFSSFSEIRKATVSYTPHGVDRQK